MFCHGFLALLLLAFLRLVRSAQYVITNFSGPQGIFSIKVDRGGVCSLSTAPGKKIDCLKSGSSIGQSDSLLYLFKRKKDHFGLIKKTKIAPFNHKLKAVMKMKDVNVNKVPKAGLLRIFDRKSNLWLYDIPKIPVMSRTNEFYKVLGIRKTLSGELRKYRRFVLSGLPCQIDFDQDICIHHKKNRFKKGQHTRTMVVFEYPTDAKASKYISLSLPKSDAESSNHYMYFDGRMKGNVFLQHGNAQYVAWNGNVGLYNRQKLGGVQFPVAVVLTLKTGGRKKRSLLTIEAPECTLIWSPLRCKNLGRDASASILRICPVMEHEMNYYHVYNIPQTGCPIKMQIKDTVFPTGNAVAVRALDNSAVMQFPNEPFKLLNGEYTAVA